MAAGGRLAVFIAPGKSAGEATMKRLALMAAAAALATPVFAALPVGNSAPAFEAEAAVAGEQFTFKLAEALKKGPVVVYFYPKANSSGCDIEAREYSEASDEFAALGASIIGV